MENITVIKFGGSLAKNEEAKNKFLNELAALAKKQPVVLVHGGGPEINSWLAKLGIQSKFVNGLRYTDAQTLEVVEMALSGKLNKYFVGELYKRGVLACGISGRDCGLAPSKHISSLGFVGEPKKINADILKLLLKAGYVPVVSSLGISAAGDALNLNADTLATAIATELKARRLILLTDVCGVLDAEKKTIPCIKLSEAKKLVTGGVVTGGMIPKLNACVLSVKKGIREVWIADGVKGLKDLSGTVIKK
jgi:acetylglutamate kinase